MTAPGSLEWRRLELDRLFEFAAGARLADSGFGWLDDSGQLAPSGTAFTWITCRMTHVFALATRMGMPGADDLVAHGVRSLLGSLYDQQDGGWWEAVDASGPVSTDKRAYDHAFVLLAASSALAVEAPDALELFTRARGVLIEHFWDARFGRMVETWDRSWRTLSPYRGVNSNMHAVEALLAASATTGDPELAEHAALIVDWVVHAARAHSWRIPEHFDEQWTPLLDYNRDRPADRFLPYGSTIGHGLEWARLMLHLRSLEGCVLPAHRDQLLDSARELFDRAVTDGWSVDGAPGFVYTVDWKGRPVVHDRMHWVLTEGISTAAVLSRATGDAVYQEWQDRFWRYADVYLCDRSQGSWHHQLDRLNRPSSTVWEGKPDVYHAVQALLLPDLPLAPGVMPLPAAVPTRKDGR